MDKNLQTLELDKVLALLAEQTTCDDAKEAALALRPAADPGEIALLLDQTEDAFSMLARFGAPSFGGLHNVNGPLQRAAAGGCLNMTELLQVGDTLRALRILDDWHGHLAGTSSSLNFFFDGITVNKYLENRIFTCIVSPEEMADKASEELYDIRRKIKAKAAAIRQRLDGMIHSTHYQKFLQEPIVTQRGGRFVVPVKAEHRGEVPGLVHDTSSSGATVFIEPAAVVDANNDIKVLEGREREEVQRILFELSAEAGTFAESVRHSYDSAVRLNLIFAKAHLAYQMKAARPQLNTEGVTDLKNARHPLIDKERVVPVHITLGADYDTLVITGPNTGGKTVTLKTLGLLTAMVGCGLLIPVSDGSKLALYRQILVDIGDEQSIAQNLSTFSSHMVNIIDIMGKADKDSLVLIDELGAGTDPIEGAALAVSVIEYLRQKGAHIAATTHYAELKAYALATPGVSNGCCEFDVETLRPTYRLLIGVPGRSNAFAITEHLGMDPAVVRAAKEIVGSENRQFESVLENLESARKALDEERAAASKERQEAERLAAKAREEKSKIDTLRDRELDKAKREAQRLVDAAKRTSSDFLLQLEQLKKEQTATNATELARKTRREIKNRLGELDDIVNPNRLNTDWDADYKLPRPLQVGDHVLIKGIGEGDVLELGSKILVSSGMLKTRVKPTDLRLLPPKKKTPITGQRTLRRTTSRADADVKTELDLRGQTVEEALGNLGLFIDKCVLNNISEVRIIHGKGTGALRTAVQEELRHHPNVAEYRLGVYGEGENGVTIAKLK